jgi:hypothetical protein
MRGTATESRSTDMFWGFQFESNKATKMEWEGRNWEEAKDKQQKKDKQSLIFPLYIIDYCCILFEGAQQGRLVHLRDSGSIQSFPHYSTLSFLVSICLPRRRGLSSPCSFNLNELRWTQFFSNLEPSGALPIKHVGFCWWMSSAWRVWRHRIFIKLTKHPATPLYWYKYCLWTRPVVANSSTMHFYKPNEGHRAHAAVECRAFSMSSIAVFAWSDGNVAMRLSFLEHVAGICWVAHGWCLCLQNAMSSEVLYSQTNWMVTSPGFAICQCRSLFFSLFVRTVSHAN